jgi:hypothetical protein
MEKTQLPFTIQPQLTETTCGPTCLHAIYNYYNDHLSLDSLNSEIHMLDGGGTLAVFLACHALRRGYTATIYTYNLQVFDPTWFNAGAQGNLSEKLRLQALRKDDPKLQIAVRGYEEFLSLKGQLKFEDLNSSLIRHYLKRGIPILTGLSATYLHRTPRENYLTNKEDDIGGTPTGHFVVLYGYDREDKLVYIAEPLHPSPLGSGHYFAVKIDRLICSILLGIVTYDANLLIIEKPEGAIHGKSHSSQ